MATAFGLAAVKAGIRIDRITLAEWMSTLIQAERSHRVHVKMRSLVHLSMLMSDDRGFLPISLGGASLFFQRVTARYEKGAMILTSNLGFTDWGEMFGDPVTALLDRLRHHSIVISITGHNSRFRDPMELVPDHIRAKKSLLPPPPPVQRGCKRKPKGGDGYEPFQASKVIIFLLRNRPVFDRNNGVILNRY